jgi:hypothetical protein
MIIINLYLKINKNQINKIKIKITQNKINKIIIKK